MTRARAIVMGFAIASSGCSLFRHPAAPGPAPEVGVASWYGGNLHGHRTASGDTFDQRELSAAHPTLPLGTRVHVTNLANGRSVVVRINDRGPFVRGRTIDVSRAAAERLGMLRRGTARVRIEVVGGSEPPVAGRARLRRPASPRRRHRRSRQP
jgi:peptidoglycan lytic transglycosylase